MATKKAEPTVAELKKQNRELKKYLSNITGMVIQFEDQIDYLMKQVETKDFGSRVAKSMNILTMQNQQALHFGLGYSFDKIGKLYKRKQP